MTLKKWIKYVNSLEKVIIWGKDDEEPLFEGPVFEIPWTLVDCKIGSTDNICEESIHLADLSQPTLIINIIDE